MASVERIPLDATRWFNESVGTAQLYYRKNPYEYVKVQSKTGGGYPPGTWFHNPDPLNKDEFITFDVVNTGAGATPSRATPAVATPSRATPAVAADGESGIRDATDEFEGSVRNAQKYYRDNDYEHVKVQSKTGGGSHPRGTWFHNPYPSNKDEFITFDVVNTGAGATPAVATPSRATPAVAVAVEKSPRDATDEFGKSVGTAQLYYRKNPYEYVQVFSKRVGKWFHNPNETEPDNFISMVKAIFFDVDGTLIIGHTRGVYGDKTKGYTGKNESHSFITPDRLDKIKKDLEELISNGYTLFINSRGNFKSVDLLLHHLNLLQYFDKNLVQYFGINNILTAKMPGDICSFYGIKKSYEIANTEWDKIKTYFMNMVVTKYNLDKNDVWFFDDTETNIEYAKAQGYLNSFVVNNTPESGISLVELIKSQFDIPKESSGGKKNRRHRKGKKKIKRTRNTRRHKNKRTRNTRRHKNKRTRNTRRRKNT